MKRKARERDLETSRRLAQLAKRRELKQAGISTKLKTNKKGVRTSHTWAESRAPSRYPLHHHF
jgi:hypothetical protein